ncbi:MAG: hypothetical protein JWM86_2050 [Thermoleophilia bacterium]|nr:hypothetical protein [Thermoleophilia bacterium]
MVHLPRDPNTPDPVSVSGSQATPDVQVTMLTGETGARIPTGEHVRSAALPDPDAQRHGASQDRLAVVAMLVGILLLAVIAVGIARLVG